MEIEQTNLGTDLVAGDAKAEGTGFKSCEVEGNRGHQKSEEYMILVSVTIRKLFVSIMYQDCYVSIS